MTIRLNPYLGFADNAREAITFYHTVFGGKLDISPFGDMAHDPSERDKVMHAQLETPDGLILMASDTPAGMARKPGDNITVSLTGDDEAQIRRYWDQLAQGGQVTVPLAKAPWGDTFGMLVDKFGIPWMIDIYAGQNG